ncbi:MAG: hypothetical protein C0597_02930, partial [Marinilabiliales bacterium]
MKKLLNQIGLLMLALMALILIGCSDEDDPLPENPSDMPYSIVIDPTNFLSQNINGNLYFPINQGTTYIFVGENEDGEVVRVEEEHTLETKLILGVTCVVIHAREYENGELVEDTYDWYAQDIEGNIWYFG